MDEINVGVAVTAVKRVTYYVYKHFVQSIEDVCFVRLVRLTKAVMRTRLKYFVRRSTISHGHLMGGLQSNRSQNFTAPPPIVTTLLFKLRADVDERQFGLQLVPR
jgi:hypothetical protein